MNLFFVIVASLLIGSIAGFVAGFFGVGGGVIYVPGLIFYFGGGRNPHFTQIATATSLGAILITSFYSGYLHRKKGDANLREVLFIVMGGIPAAFLAARIATHIPGLTLRKIFGLVEITIAVLYLTILSKRKEGDNTPSPLQLTLTGLAAGSLSGLLGIGGGIVAVPLMNLVLRMPIKRAVGNSANMIFFNALAGTISYLIATPPFQPPPMTVGYVNIPAAILLGLSSIMAVRLSVRIFLRTESKVVKIIYSFFLFIIGLKLIFW